MNLRKEELEKLRQESDEELIAIMCDFHEEKSHLAKFIYENRCREREQQFNRDQNALQHKRNTELVEKQLRWVKISTAIVALATLAGVVLGWYLKELKQTESPQAAYIHQTLQGRTLSSPIGPLPSNSITPEKAKEEQKLKKK